MTPLSFCPVNWAITWAVWVIWDVLGQGCSQKSGIFRDFSQKGGMQNHRESGRQNIPQVFKCKIGHDLYQLQQDFDYLCQYIMILIIYACIYLSYILKVGDPGVQTLQIIFIVRKKIWLR